MIDLKSIKIADIDYITSRNKTILKKNNINTVYDLLYSYPSRYEDFRPTPYSSITSIEQDHIVLEGMINSKISVNYINARMNSTSFYLYIKINNEKDLSLRCSIFNRTFLKDKLKLGTIIRVVGKFYKNFNNFTVSDILFLDEVSTDMVPVYKVKDISVAKYADMIGMVYEEYKDDIVESLPSDIINNKQLLSLKDTVKYLHFPNNNELLEKAYFRVKYEELLDYQLSMKYLHYMRENTLKCDEIHYDYSLVDKLIKSLPYELTKDQEKVIEEILSDLKSGYPMNRLLQGEVGSGKTIVALCAILATCSDKFQSVLMCPTEILAKQHFETVSELLKDFECIKPVLLVGSLGVKERNNVLQQISEGNATVIIGTHAVFSNDVDYKKLGLVVADEEHRFGVKQRVLIKNKGADVNYLKMSATPIPRSLAISAYGDTDISIIKTMPLYRKQPITKYVSENDKVLVINHMKEEIKNGHQIYVVTPLIEESENLDTANALEIYENMKKYFDGICNVGLVHGRLKTNEKDEVIEKFANNDIQILVATSVIEVGVNIPNATTIVILGADRFGVATLHQLRGRVMRSSETPYCFLVSENPTEQSLMRLKMVEETTDGFKLAEYDLKHRGPGEFFGEKQSGSMNFKFADLRDDTDILDEANADSEKIIHDEKLFNNSEYSNLYDIIKENYRLKTEVID